MICEKRLSAVLVAVVVLLFVGQSMSYWAAPFSYGISVTPTKGGFDCTIRSNIDTRYSLAVLGHGQDYEINSVAFYYDEGYFHRVSNDYQRELASNLRIALSIYGMSDFKVLNAMEMKELIENSLEAGAMNTALVFMSGSLPSVLYRGDDGCPIISWLRNGGVVYWAGNPIGQLISYGDGKTLSRAPWDHEALFYGARGVVRTSEERLFSTERIDGELGPALGAITNECTFGLRSSSMENALSIGYISTDGYTSITLAKYPEGSGMIASFGRSPSLDINYQVASLIASGATYTTQVLTWATGDITSGKKTISISSQDGGCVYVTLGEMFTIYGRAIRIP